MPENKNPAPNPAAPAQVAYQAIATMLVQGGLPPEAIEHLKAAHESILALATALATLQAPNEGGVPLGESVAASKRRANGEDPEDRDDEDPDGDNAPAEKAKGDKANPLSLVKRWASTTTKDDDEPEEKPKPAATLANGGKPRFLGRGR